MRTPLLPRPEFLADAALQKKIKYTLFVELLLFVVVYFVGSALQGLLTAIPTGLWIFGSGQLNGVALQSVEDAQALLLKLLRNLPDWLVVVSLFTYAVYGAAAMFFCRKVEKRQLRTMGLLRQEAAGEYLLGLTVGLGLVCALVLLGIAVGAFTVEGLSDSGLWLPLAALLLGCLVRGMAEEILYRGYLAVSLSARMPLGMAIAVSVFTQLMVTSGYSLLAPLGLLNTLLLGVLLSVYTFKRGSLWGGGAIRGLWIFGLGGLFRFGDGSLTNGLYLVNLKVSPYRAALTGGDYGPESSIITTVVLLAGLAAVFALRPRHPAPQAPQQVPPEV